MPSTRRTNKSESKAHSRALLLGAAGGNGPMPNKRLRVPASARMRASVQIGSSRINASDLKGLQFAWRNKQLILFLGAGVSLAYGIPGWKNLVLEILFDQTEHARRL